MPRAKKIIAPEPAPKPAAYQWALRLLSQHARILTLGGGAAVVALWTLLRHITNGINFDVVGQIGVAQQWAQGFQDGAQLGATSYLLKIPLYLAVNGLTFLVPIHRLLLLALLFNIATFVLLFLLFEKILALYNIERRPTFYLAMAWLTTISGSVFWLDYANSRNLETVGGVLFLYLVLRYVKFQQRVIFLALLLTGVVVFFADPLQLYVCGAGACLFVAVRLIWQRTKSDVLIAGTIILLTLLGYLGAKVLNRLATIYLHVTFLTAPSSAPRRSLSYIKGVGQGLLANTLKVFDADVLKHPYGINIIREGMNLVVLLVLVGLIIKMLPKARARSLYGLIGLVILVNYSVYIASGQILQWSTYRYLIMVPLLAALLITAASDRIGDSKKWRATQAIWLTIILASAVLLAGGLAVSWPTRHSKDAHIGNLISSLEQNHFKYAIGSREAGITTTYFSQGKAIVLPMACAGDRELHPTDLFYDNAAFKSLYQYDGEVPVILQNNEIRFGSYTCKHDDVTSQFGLPKREFAIPGVGAALVYDAEALSFDEIDALAGRRVPKHTTSAPVPTNVAPAAESSALKALEGCANGTVDVVVAHPDDDILFMNPSLAAQVTSKCIRTVYVTAADDGRSSQYWKGRELGIEAAYALMLGADNSWTEEVVTVNGHHMLSSRLNGHPAIGLLFLHLPDGNTNGRGFRQNGYESVEKLANHSIRAITPIDGSEPYAYKDLVSTIGIVLDTDRPGSIFTHLMNGQRSIGDHSDHRSVGRLAIAARNLSAPVTAVTMYVGYPSNGLPPNLSAEEAQRKRTVFYTYAYHDGLICSANSTCSVEETYGRYFSRSYLINLVQQPLRLTLLSLPMLWDHMPH